MRSLMFSANLNFLFAETSSCVLDRIAAAGKGGFRGIEIGYPSKDVIDKVAESQKEAEVEVALINISLNGGEKFTFGPTSIPNEEEQFKENLNETICLAKQLQCKKIHLMAGKKIGSFADHYKTYVSNLKYAAGELEKENIIGLIEPINKYAVPGYFLDSFDTAVDVLNEVNSESIKLMIDVYHLQHIRGNVSYSFNELKPYIGHIQIAQVPGRHEPDSPGELDYEYVFKIIKESGYNGWIGCEYKPIGCTVDGLGWISKFGFKL